MLSLNNVCPINTFQFMYACPIAESDALKPPFLSQHLANYAHVGHVFTRDGTALCNYCTLSPSQDFCERAIEDVKKIIKQQDLQAWEHLPVTDRYDKGYPILNEGLAQVGYSIPSDCWLIRLKVNSLDKLSIEEAIKFINQNVEEAFSNAKTLEAFFINLNKCLTKDMDHPENQLGYRTKNMFVMREKSDPLLTQDEHLQNIKEKIINRLKSQELELLAFETFSPSQREKINKKLTGIYYISPSSKEVPQAMKSFFENLFTELKQPKRSPYEIAASAHMNYVFIHPHYDANGKGARFLFNIILRYFNQEPLVFPSDEEYTLAVENESRDPGSFVKYVREKVIPWNKENSHHLNPNPV